MCSVSGAVHELLLPRNQHCERKMKTYSKQRQRIVGWIHCFANDQTGASYSISFLVMFPFFFLLIISFIEVAIFLNLKTAVHKTAISTARSLAVTLPSEPLDEVNAPGLTPDQRNRENMRRIFGLTWAKAAASMAPFASGDELHGNLPDNGFVFPSDSGEQWAKTHNKIGGTHNVAYLGRKFRNAARALKYEVVPINMGTGAKISEAEFIADPHAGIQVTVEYEAPFHTAGAGWLFGKRQPAGFFTRTIRSTAIAQKEGPKSEDHRLPFRDYYADHGFRSNVHTSLVAKVLDPNFGDSTETLRFAEGEGRSDSDAASKSTGPGAIYDDEGNLIVSWEKRTWVKDLIVYGPDGDAYVVPVYLIDGGSGIGRGKYIPSEPAIYLNEELNPFVLANEEKHAQDDANYGKLGDGILGDESGRRLSYLEAEIRSDEASIEEVERRVEQWTKDCAAGGGWLCESRGATRKWNESRGYKQRIDVLKQAQSMIKQSRFEAARALGAQYPDFAGYIETAIRQSQREK